MASRRHPEDTPDLRHSKRKKLQSHAEATARRATHRHRHRIHTHTDTWGLAPRPPHSHRNIRAQAHSGGGSHTQISWNVTTHNPHVTGYRRSLRCPWGYMHHHHLPPPPRMRQICVHAFRPLGMPRVGETLREAHTHRQSHRVPGDTPTYSWSHRHDSVAETHGDAQSWSSTAEVKDSKIHSHPGT